MNLCGFSHIFTFAACILEGNTTLLGGCRVERKKEIFETVEKKTARDCEKWSSVCLSPLSPFVGVQFYLFTLHFDSHGATPYVERPPAVEGFLPISALVGLKVWTLLGEFDPIHPAGLLLFTFIIASGLFFRRLFCSWMCPVGTVSEWVGIMGKKVFKKNVDLPRWMTWILTPMKYLLLAFFIKIVIFDMPVDAARAFLKT